MALTNKLTAIADAIRTKTNTTDTMTLDQMAIAISGITGGGSGEGGDVLPEEAFLLTGDCSYAFGSKVGWFIDDFGDRITTKDITNASNMFYKCGAENIGFEINFKEGQTYHDVGALFDGSNITSVPKINNCKPYSMQYFFRSCIRLQEIPTDFAQWLDWSYINNLTSAYQGNMQRMFSGCNSLRSFPIDIFENGNVYTATGNSYFNYGFDSCYILDELVDLPLIFETNWTSNAFNSTFSNCYRLKNITFATNEDGTPKIMNWKTQTIDLSSYVGYCSSIYHITFNSDYHGITKDTEVTNDATYQTMKSDPNWFTCNVAYSRYNHDSAVATINSLPDTSAYLASAGGTNTIKFKGAAGSATDGGAINTLTEEEIAIAASRGWTITLV